MNASYTHAGYIEYVAILVLHVLIHVLYKRFSFRYCFDGNVQDILVQYKSKIAETKQKTKSLRDQCHASKVRYNGYYLQHEPARIND